MTVNPGQLFSNHYAFLVGVDGYRDPNFADLGGAHADAKAMHEALLTVGYPAGNLRLVPSEKTSWKSLLPEFYQFASLAKQCLKRPDILVFWAGHGVPADQISYLITQESEYGDLEHSAIPLGLLATELFKICFPASLTMFFDVCHSVPRDRPDVLRDAKNLILEPMRNNIRNDSLRWSFVGVSTYAYEYPVASVRREEGAAQRGILATVLERAILGRPCDDQDGYLCLDPDCVVSVEHLLSKLEGPVTRRAAELGVAERVAVLRDRDGLDHPKAIGLDVKRFEALRLDHEKLPPQADLLARAILAKELGKGGNIPRFSQKLAGLVRDLIWGTLERDDFVRRERVLVRSAILDLRTDPNLNAYTGLLLHCRQEAARDAAARDVLVRLYEHLVWGGSPGVLEEYLRSQDRLFASRDALPWSCGIRVLRGEDEHGYAPILKAGAAVRPSSNDASRTFVTTSTLQLKALIHIYRGDATVSSIRNSDLQSCDYLAAAKFAHELAVGTRVWVKMGPDENGCGPGCEDQATSVYAPMSILLGREGIKEHDWKGHWHLDLGGTDDEIGGGPGPDPAPVWVTKMERIIDECFQFLMTLEGGHAEEMEQVVINWLYNAERLMRARDESKLRHVLEKLIEGLRRNPASSALRLAGALRSAVDPSTGGLQQPIMDEKKSTERYKEVSRDVLEYYERWRADHAREAPPVELGNHEILARLLQAVIAPPGNPLRIATENVAGFTFVAAMTEPVRPVAAARATSAVVRVIDQGNVPDPHLAGVRQVARGLLALAVNNFVQSAGSDLFSTQQQRSLLRWIESTTGASEQDSVENALGQLLALLRTEIGLGTLLLAQGFLDVMEVEPLSLPTFDELMTRLRHGADISGTREAAEQMYRLLRQLYRDRHRSGELLREDAAVFLLALAALLWPENEELVVRLLTTAAVDLWAATEISHEALDLDQDNLAGVVDADLSTDQLLKNAAMVDQVRQSWNRMGQIVYRRTTPWMSSSPTDVRGPEAERWHDPMLLGIPSEESHQV